MKETSFFIRGDGEKMDKEAYFTNGGAEWGNNTMPWVSKPKYD